LKHLCKHSDLAFPEAGYEIELNTKNLNTLPETSGQTMENVKSMKISDAMCFFFFLVLLFF